MASYIEQRNFDELLSAMRDRAGPFSTSTSSKDDADEFDKFIGREAEISLILDEVEKVRDTGRSRAVRLQGEGGVGKTALFNYMWRGLKMQRGTPRMQQMLRDHHVEVGFITCTDEVLSFIGFWRLLCETLEIDNQNFFELLLYRVIIKLWNLYKATGQEANRKELEQLVFGDPQRFFGLHAALTFEELRSYFQEPRLPLSRADGRDALKKFFRKAVWDMARHQTSVSLPNQPARKVKFDPRAGSRYIEWLIDLVPDDEGNFNTCWSQIYEPREDNPWLKTDGDTFKFFDWVKETFEWAEGRPVLFLVAIDELLKPITRSSDPLAWKKFGTLLVTIRNNLKHVLWVLIDTDEEWRQYDIALQSKTDLQGQVAGFIEQRIPLNPLNSDEMVQALERRISLFWRSTSMAITRENPAAPFTRSGLEYIINYFNRRLRKCIQGCDTAWSFVRNLTAMHQFITFYDMMHIIRSQQSDLPPPGDFTIDKLYGFEKTFLLNEFWKTGRFSTEGERSTHVEEALVKAFLLLRQDPGTSIHDVKHNKQRGVARRPDVLVIFSSGDGSAKELNVEYQVKIYTRGTALDNSISPGHLDSSISLLQDHVTDALYLVSTVPPAPASRALLATFAERVLNLQPINDHQLAALLCFHEFERLFHRPLVLQEAKALMSVILNKPWDVHVQDTRLVIPWHDSPPAENVCEPAPTTSTVPSAAGQPGHMPALDSGAMPGVQPASAQSTGMLTTTRPVEAEAAPSSQPIASTRPAPPVTKQPQQTTLMPQGAPPGGGTSYIDEIRSSVPGLAHAEATLVYTMKSAYNNKRSKNSITISTLKKNLPTGLSATDLKKIFSISSCRFYSIPQDDKQKFILSVDGRAFLEKYNLT